MLSTNFSELFVTVVISTLRKVFTCWVRDHLIVVIV